ncbi:primosomal protein N' [Alteromonas sp. ASW11-19]|uniref:Replication restart protein PriA n=1 Tax=Alteromonas salexigens TaxID=2982530 RepID=A0ABT2VMI1_9ALTE|nr:primosomal protein N' [Alteromonas salexigens]MCU7554521.1 primosomal protein N' [Alteromonas salexigens]
MALIDVAVPVPLRQTFTYTCDTVLPAGVRVKVPFGNRQLVGIVMGEAAPTESDKLKAVSTVLDTTPVLDASLLTLCRWLSQYYHHAPGEVLHTVLPVLLRKGERATPDDIVLLTATTEGQNCSLSELQRAPKQQACLAWLREQSQPRSDVTSAYSAAVVKSLADKSLIEEVRQPWQPRPFHFVDALHVQGAPVPDKEQAVAIAAISSQRHAFASFLLEGVTGSGKTEVYLQAIEPVLRDGKQVLILVPEIGLTPQTVRRFENRFGIAVGVLHSQLTDTARLKVWQQAREGELGIIIGTRSAIFTPLKRPGMLIVDEEHDESFKQQDGLRYHARDLAVLRAKDAQIPLVMGTATPSLETLNNALAGRYHHLQLTRRAGGAQSTRQHVLDIRDQPLRHGIAEGLLTVMRQHLQQGNQVLVFVNRRGFAPALLCHHCGATETCQRCERPFTVHRSFNRMQCHHCAATRPIPGRCESCGSQELVTSGVGTEQVESGLATLFPHVAQVRIDSDSVRGKDKLQDTLQKVNAREYQILIGTQILSKGHHFPHVTLVVVLDCDGALFSADFRAAEKLAQLVTQLAGRAGRASKPGEMWLQTHNPDHPLLQDLVHNGYGHFARQALAERQMAALPPFTSQIVIRAEATDGRQAYDYLMACRTVLQQDGSVTLIGPMPTLMEKRQGRFRFMLVCQHDRRKPLHDALRLAMPYFASHRLANRVRWSVDIDPTDFS